MKHQSIIRTLCVGACALSLVSCAGKSKKGHDVSASNAPVVDSDKEGSNAVFANQLAAQAGGPARLRIVRLEVFQLLLPLGAVSRSEEFWKHVEEHRIDVGTYDLLRKNGWRLGIAPTAEWNYFRDIIDAYPASAKPTWRVNTGPGGAGGLLELPMKESVPYQNIFYFSDNNVLFGRTFERCDNLLNITVQEVARKPGEARVTVCPMVRSLRKRFEVTVNNNEREIRYVHPERLYDLNLQVDIPMGQFLVIAPSPEVRWKTSLGATFLVHDGAAEQSEQVLLLVPRAEEFQEAAPAAPAK